LEEESRVGLFKVYGVGKKDLPIETKKTSGTISLQSKKGECQLMLSDPFGFILRHKSYCSDIG